MSGPLEAGLVEHQAQLDMIDSALTLDPNNTELQELRDQLQQLVQLTKEQLIEVKKAELLAELGGPEPEEEAEQKTEQSVTEELQQLEGMRVRTVEGNAVVVGVEGGGTDSYEDIVVVLAYSHPTKEQLVPCKFYLAGRCTKADGCRWSHGERARLGELAAWREGDPAQLREGGAVLARAGGGIGIWRRATITEIVDEDYLVKFDSGAGDPELKTVDDIFPLTAESENSDSELDQEEDKVEEEEEGQESFAPLEMSWSGARFGEWEQHTRGLGSRLMSGMGWVTGQGLGSRGQGRTDPVTARLYPAGKSLDWCMERREKLGEAGLDVEKVARQEAREAEKRSRQRAQAEQRRDNSAKSLFDFINVKLGVGGSSSGRAAGKSTCSSSSSSKSKSSEQPSQQKKAELKDRTDGELQLQQFQLGERLARLEKEVERYSASHARLQVRDPTTAASVKLKLEAKQAELARLQARVKRCKQEQGNRKSKSKLSIF